MKIINKKDLSKRELVKRIEKLEEEVENLKPKPIKVKLYLGDPNDPDEKEIWRRMVKSIDQ